MMTNQKELNAALLVAVEKLQKSIGDGTKGAKDQIAQGGKGFNSSVAVAAAEGVLRTFREKRNQSL